MSQKSADAKDYEAFVSATIGEFAEFRGAVIHRNRRFDGVRQPGRYEIDIAVEHNLFGRLTLFYLIECKHLTRPVDRPEVQKLAQTRDALSAHKGIIVSASGFSAEATLVAENLGIALWTLTPNQFLVVRGLSNVSDRELQLGRFRQFVTALFCAPSTESRNERLMEFDSAADGSLSFLSGMSTSPDLLEPGVDPRTARHGLILHILETIGARRQDEADAAAIAEIIVREAMANAFPGTFDQLLARYAGR